MRPYLPLRKVSLAFVDQPYFCSHTSRGLGTNRDSDASGRFKDIRRSSVILLTYYSVNPLNIHDRYWPGITYPTELCPGRGPCDCNQVASLRLLLSSRSMSLVLQCGGAFAPTVSFSFRISATTCTHTKHTLEHTNMGSILHWCLPLRLPLLPFPGPKFEANEAYYRREDYTLQY